jgi:hypothetical protein
MNDIYIYIIYTINLLYNTIIYIRMWLDFGPNRVYFQLVKWTAQAAPSQLAKSSGPTNSWLHCRYPKPPQRRQRVASIQCSSLHKRHRVMNGQQITRRWWQRQASPFARWSLRYSFSFIQ